ncbi:uncharacterized protein JCM10292_000134 [Rhodotorula paludigena]|uniref:uncharacterized protein n=1 Tax=Rhodotorula paludigena TaxID=86838 RepID=UPI003178485A
MAHLRGTGLLRSAGAPVASSSRCIPPPLARSYSAPRQRSWDAQDDTPHHSRGDERSWSPPVRSGEGGFKPKKERSKIVHPPPTPDQLERYRQERVRRAERLERKDLTAQLTETKTYMGGFTQPRHLQYLTTLDPTRKPKDSYDVRVGESRTRPAAEAYEPHTVYLAVTRYPVRWGHGRATRREVFGGYCKESELEERFRALNYGTWAEERTDFVKLRHGRPKEPVVTPAHWACLSESKEYIDLAVLPGSPEERALLNRSSGRLITSLMKERKRLVAAFEADADPSEPAKASHAQTLADLDKELTDLRSQLHPPVTEWTRPDPPHLSPPLVVPFVTATLPTRPLAATVARLSKGHQRGLPFIASVPNTDRKDGPALFRRLLRMRTNRLQQVSRELLFKLEGHAGGLMGLRMSPEDRGRGIEGEGLGETIAAPERGWIEYSWLDDASTCWDGIARDEYLASWEDMASAKKGPARAEDGKWVTPHPLVKAPSVAPDERAESVVTEDRSMLAAEQTDVNAMMEAVEPASASA